MLEQPDVVALFDKYNVLSPRELHSRYEIYLEQYCKTVNVEAKLTTRWPRRRSSGGHSLPAGELAENATAVKAAGFTPDTDDAQDR